MFHCPRCKTELPADALFCNSCGFNQTNARMKAMSQQQGNPGATPPVRSIQPQVKHTPQQGPQAQQAPQAAENSSQQQAKQSYTSQQPYRATPAPAPVQNSTAQAPNAPQKSDEDLRPVRTNTPKRQTNPSIPVRPSVKMPAPPQSAEFPPVMPSGPMPATPPHLAALKPSTPASRPAASEPLVPTTPSVPSTPAVRETPNPALPQSGGASPEKAPPAKGMSLTKRYLEGQFTQRPEQKSPAQPTPISPAPTPGVPATPAPPVSPPENRPSWQGSVQQPPATPQPAPNSWSGMPLPPVPSTRPAQPGSYQQMNGHQGMDNGASSAPDRDMHINGGMGGGALTGDPLGIFAMPGASVESTEATKKAAERWRKSWRERQKAEAGPAVGVTRGQASVAEPLMAMQHSIVRMRAIILPKKEAEQKRGGVKYGLTILALLCLLAGLGASIAYSYLPGNASQLPTHAAPAKGGPTPVLSVPQGKSTAVAPGQSLQVHGEYFGAQDTISFILDTTPIHPKTNDYIQSSTRGSFDASLPIDTTWQAGNYALTAQDSRTGQRATMSIQILPPPNTPNATVLQLEVQGEPIQNLSFASTYGKGNPDSQWINLVNTSTTNKVTWSVTALTTSSTNWLVISDSKAGGQLDIQGTDTIGISVQTSGLPGSTTPYQGYIIFNVEKQGQVVLPVSLRVQNPAIEVAITPNPIVALLKPAAQGECQDISLTLANLSDQVVFWNANPFTDDQNHIHLNDQPTANGILQPVGQDGDTAVVKITCINVRLGEKLYNITVSYNVNSGGGSQTIPVSIRTSY